MKLKLLALTALLAVSPVAFAEGEEHTNESLAKSLQNPVAPLINVPFQNNFYSGMGDNGDGKSYVLRLQPVIPLPFNKEYAVVSRSVIPYISQHDVYGTTSQSGLGDWEQSFFFTPMHPESKTFKWGAGPVLHFPTATDRILGTEKWGLGPTGVALVQDGPWTGGVLANHVWSFAGTKSRTDISQTYFKPFAAYTFPSGFSVNSTLESTYDWKACKWSIPLVAGVSQVFAIKGHRMSLGVFGMYDPEFAGNKFTPRVALTLVFPETVNKK